MSPVGTSLDLANRITRTKASIIRVNITTPKIIVDINYSFIAAVYPTYS
ncbi:Uncharacterised protein [Vibrio cholerae]|nr:Uncharacterised protein [Vibrio cholerae]CSI20226.1 Uncharacterised protein [Vibrio cholerae]